jgi:twinkle protein
MEINGFQIEKFNQYGLDERAKLSTCPLCSSERKKKTDKCASLHWDTGLGVCHHCGEAFQLHTYQKKKEVKEYKRPVKWNYTDLSDKLVKWFECRGVSQFTLRMMKVGEGKESMPIKGQWLERNTIQFNFFENNEIVNIKYRDGQKNFKLFKDAKLIFYNLDAISISKEAVIVEGEIDCLSYFEAGIHKVVSTPNGSTLKAVNLEYLDNCIEYFDNKEKIYLALDNDEAGQNVTREFVRRLGAERCFLVDFKDCKDANEYLIKYGKESLSNTITEAKEIPIDGVSSVMDWEKRYDEFLLNGMNKGFVTGKTAFDTIFSTYTGQYIVVTGIPSSGKSDFVDEMCIGYNMNYGWRTAYASPENVPCEIHASKLEAKICGQWVSRPDQVNSLWHKEAKQFIDSNFKFIELDSFDLDEVLAKTKRLIRKFGIKVLVIDPYNKVRLKTSLNKNTNEYTNDYLNRIDEFARNNDILIVLVAHPVKPSGIERLTYEPDFYSIKGGGEFYDMSPHGLLVHRDYELDMVKVKVLKVKFSHLGTNRAHVWYKWNRNNGRYSEFTYQDKEAIKCSNCEEDNSNWIVEDENTTKQESIEFAQPVNRIEPNYNFEDEYKPDGIDIPF